MAKFQVPIMRSVQQTCVIELSITKREIVEALDLDREGRENWRDFVDDYVAMECDLEHEFMTQDPNVETDESEAWEVDGPVEEI